MNDYVTCEVNNYVTCEEKYNVMCEEVFSKPGGLNLSRRDLDRESRQSRKSQHFQKVSLDFVSTPPSSPKSLDRDREICRDMIFLANLDSLSRSRYLDRELVNFITFLDRDFSICQDF